MFIHCHRFAGVTVCLLGTAGLVHATEPPLLSPEHKVLDRLLGTWKVSYKLAKAEWTPEERKGTADDTYSCVLEGTFVQCKGEQSDRTSNLTMFTYDADRKCYRAWWFGSTGKSSESTGKWDADAKSLTWTSSAGEGLTGTMVHHFVNDDSIEWSVAVKDKSGKVYFAMEGKSSRVKDTKK